MNIDRVKLRVFHRTKTDISLLWSTAHLNDDQRNSVKVLCEGKPLSISLSSPGDKDDVARDTSICLIDHEMNGLKPDAKYVLQVVLGGETGEPLVRKIVVLEYGVLPPFDRDRKASRVHPLFWAAEASTWVKLPLVETEDGGYALPVVIMEPKKKKSGK